MVLKVIGVTRVIRVVKVLLPCVYELVLASASRALPVPNKRGY